VKLKDQVKAEIKNKLNLHLLRVAHWLSSVQPVTSLTSLPWLQNKRLHFNNIRKAQLYRLQGVTLLHSPLNDVSDRKWPLTWLSHMLVGTNI